MGGGGLCWVSEMHPSSGRLGSPHIQVLGVHPCRRPNPSLNQSLTQPRILVLVVTVVLIETSKFLLTEHFLNSSALNPSC